MKNAVIVHGWGADSQGNWFSWLAQELKKNRFEVTTPDFPDSDYPDLSAWLHYFKNNVSINSDTILIGHSLGVAFILRFLEYLSNPSRNEIPDRVLDDSKKVKGAFLVAAFGKSLGISEIENFVDKPFDFTKIKNVCETFTIINSDNDPYIPLSIGKDLAKSLDAKLIVEKDGGHLQNPSGLFSYPKLLDLIIRE